MIRDTNRCVATRSSAEASALFCCFLLALPDFDEDGEPEPELFTLTLRI